MANDVELWTATQRITNDLDQGHMQLAVVVKGEKEQMVVLLTAEEVYQLLRRGFDERFRVKGG